MHVISPFMIACMVEHSNFWFHSCVFSTCCFHEGCYYIATHSITEPCHYDKHIQVTAHLCMTFTFTCVAFSVIIRHRRRRRRHTYLRTIRSHFLSPYMHGMFSNNIWAHFHSSSIFPVLSFHVFLYSKAIVQSFLFDNPSRTFCLLTSANEPDRI